MCIELQQIKGMLDHWIKERNACVGRFTSKPRVDVGGIEVHMNIQLFARLYTTVNRNIERGHQVSGYVDFLSQSVVISTVM